MNHMHAEPRSLVCTDQLRSVERLITCKTLANDGEAVNVSSEWWENECFWCHGGGLMTLHTLTSAAWYNYIINMRSLFIMLFALVQLSFTHTFYSLSLVCTGKSPRLCVWSPHPSLPAAFHHQSFHRCSQENGSVHFTLTLRMIALVSIFMMTLCSINLKFFQCISLMHV